MKLIGLSKIHLFIIAHAFTLSHTYYILSSVLEYYNYGDFELFIVSVLQTSESSIILSYQTV